MEHTFLLERLIAAPYLQFSKASVSIPVELSPRFNHKVDDHHTPDNQCQIQNIDKQVVDSQDK